MLIIQTKRVYDPPDPADGLRILVDRLWPRGMKKEAAHIDLWLKDVAPSSELRQWFHHQSPDWAEFCRRYTAELDARPQAVAALLEQAQHGPVTLLYSAHDVHFNQAVALRDYLLQRYG